MTLNKIYIATSVAATIMMLCLIAPAFLEGMQLLSQEWRAVVVALWIAAMCWYPVGLWLWGRIEDR